MSATTTSILSSPTSSGTFSSSMSLKPLKTPQQHSSSSCSTTTATLRSLYPRAARALLHRDIALTHSLISSAFAILQPPSTSNTLPDSLDSQRRKWDILRITFDTTLYASPPPPSATLPASIRSQTLLTAPSLVAELHDRSVKLFNPIAPSHNGKHQSNGFHIAEKSSMPTSAYLPAQILSALVFASLKLDCPDIGRGMIEDWLARRDQIPHIRDDAEGYAKSLEVYCLHVLPRLGEWEYAKDFLKWESELNEGVRRRLQSALDALHVETVEAAARYETLCSSSVSSSTSVTPTPSSSKSKSPIQNGDALLFGSRDRPSRSPSPAPSTSSSSSSASSMSTTSTHTIMPSNRTGLAPLTPSSSISLPTMDATSDNESKPPTGLIPTSPTRAKSKSSSSSASSASSAHTSVRQIVTSSTSASALPPSTLSRLTSATPSAVSTRSSSSNILNTIQQYLSHWRETYITPSRLVLAFVLVLFPLISFVLRVRRARITRNVAKDIAQNVAKTTSTAAVSIKSNASAGSVEEVKRRLGMRNGATAGESVYRAMWSEIVRAVADVVKMGGSGLV